MTISNSPAPATLADVPKRAFTFLHALGTQVSIRSVMNARGFTREDQAEGWDLLRKTSGSTVDVRGHGETLSAQAFRELDEWDETGFHLAHAALGRRFPAQAEFVFKDLAPTPGAGAVLGVMKFLDRLDELESGKGREATREEDAKAIGILAARGIGTEERTRLRNLVTVAQSEPAIPLDLPAAKDLEAERLNNLTALYAWYQEWSEVARAVIPRRGDRIVLGIAKRKKREDDALPASPAQSNASPAVPVSPI